MLYCGGMRRYALRALRTYWSALVNTCPCVVRHSPKPAYLQKHHIVPRSWGGPNTKENIVAICGTCHDATHDALNKLVRAQGYVKLTGYPRYAQMLAWHAVNTYCEKNGHWPSKFTVAHGLEVLT
jgi:hypothetical protein